MQRLSRERPQAGREGELDSQAFMAEQFHPLQLPHKAFLLTLQSAQLEGYELPKLQVDVHRSDLLEESIHWLHNQHPDDLTAGPLNVHWADEVAEGGTGPTREWLNLFAEQLLANTAGEHPITGASTADFAYALGRLLALAVLNGIAVAVRLPRFVLSHLIRSASNPESAIEFGLRDLEDLDGELAARIHRINTQESLEAAAISAGVDRRAANLHEEVIRAVGLKKAFAGDVNSGLDRLKDFTEGFVGLFRSPGRRTMLSLLSGEQLRAILTGRPVQFDAHAVASQPSHLLGLLDSIHFRGFSSAAGRTLRTRFETIWKDRYDEDGRRRLLAFITGSPHLSLAQSMLLNPSGPQSLLSSQTSSGTGIQVRLLDEVEFRGRLPWASTCATTLFLPLMPADELEAQLALSLQHGQGFGML